MGIDSDGVRVYDDDGSSAYMSSGLIGVKRGDEKNLRSAQLAISEHGGSVRVFGKGDGKSRAITTVNEYGNGAISTWDKNGYRLASVK